MSTRRSNDVKKNGEAMPVNNYRSISNDRDHSDRGRDAMRDNKRRDPSSAAWEKQQIRLENDLYERQSI
jgi:hypothetical protein